MDRFVLMQTFVSVVNHGSFTEAARQLAISRALVSKRIQSLESRLKVKLIVRDTHNSSVTAAGRNYFKDCNALLQQLAKIEDAAAQAQNEPCGEITVLSSKTFGETILAPLVATFCSLYREVGVHLTLKDLPDHATALLANGIDLAICTMPSKASALRIRKLASIPRQLVAAPAYLEEHGGPRRPADLARFNCLDPSGVAQTLWRFHAKGSVHQVRVAGTPRSNSSAVVCQAALRGLGIALVRSYLVRDHIARGELVPVLEGYAPEKRQLYLMYQRDRFIPHRTKLFVEHLCENIQAHVAT